MNFIITYLFVGIVIAFLVDLLQDGLVKRDALPQEIKENWGLVQRLIVICLWPYAIVKFIEGLIK
jgi:hypothetical protein